MRKELELQELADWLHKKFCSWNHADGCGWFYEDMRESGVGLYHNTPASWTHYAHRLWLNNAIDVLDKITLFQGSPKPGPGESYEEPHSEIR